MPYKQTQECLRDCGNLRRSDDYYSVITTVEADKRGDPCYDIGHLDKAGEFKVVHTDYDCDFDEEDNSGLLLCRCCQHMIPCA